MSGSKTITNPNGAFGYTALGDNGFQLAFDGKAAGAIAAKSPVTISSTGTIAQAATDGVGLVGVCLDELTTGETGRVVVLGAVDGVPAGGATTLGTPVIRSATTSGYVTSSATPVTGTVVGFALGASSGGTVSVWVLPGTNTSS